MIIFELVAAVLGIAAVVYLVFALVSPERFRWHGSTHHCHYWHSFSFWGHLYRPSGDYMAWAYTSGKDWRVEGGIYRLIGVDPKSEQTWPAYLRSVILVSGVGIFLLYGLQRLQHWFPYSLGMPAASQHLSFNTAISFVTNTNWQSYSGEQTLGYTVQCAGLAVQNIVSAAVGMAVAIALVRGFARNKITVIGNFWVDLTRGVLRILLPIAVIGAVLLIAG